MPALSTAGVVCGGSERESALQQRAAGARIKTMSYQLRRNQTFGANLRRICRKQVEGALEIVRGEKETNDTPVHETRKHLKKARAASQMVAEEIRHPRFKKQDRSCRHSARLL